MIGCRRQHETADEKLRRPQHVQAERDSGQIRRRQMPCHDRVHDALCHLQQLRCHQRQRKAHQRAELFGRRAHDRRL
jgi:hypothetical protein